MAKENLEQPTKYLELVQLTWIDSETLCEWKEVHALNNRLTHITTVGLLIHQDAEAYLIASTYDPVNDSVNAAIWIPRACVLTVKPLGMVQV